MDKLAGTHRNRRKADGAQPSRIRRSTAAARAARTGTQRGFAASRPLRWFAILAAASIVLIAVIAWWAIDTGSGTRFVLARAESALAGKLVVKRVNGTLAGPLTLEGIRYNDPAIGVDAKVQRLTLDIAPLALIAGRAHVENLDIMGVDVALTSVPPKPEQPASEFSLKPPINLIVDRLAVRNATIRQDGHKLLAVDRFDFAGDWSDLGIAIKRLKLRAPDGRVDLTGMLATAGGYSGHGVTTFQWKLGDVTYVGKLEATSNGKQTRLKGALTQPAAAHIDATLGQTRALPWTLRLDLPRFDPRRVVPSSELASLSLTLKGSGDRDRGTLIGNMVANDHRVKLDQLRYVLDNQTLRIQALTLKSPGASGLVNATATVQLDAKPISGRVKVGWNGVELPADLVGQLLETHGRLDAAGTADAYRAEGSLSIGPPGKVANIALKLHGTQKRVTLEQLALKQPNGDLQASGTVTLQPNFGWQLDATANKLDPGAFAVDWPGVLNFDLKTSGTLTDRGPEARLTLVKLEGRLRKRPVSGHADLTLRPSYVVDGTLALALGDSHLDLIGRGEDRTDTAVKFKIAALGEWLPGASGHGSGEFKIRGQWPDLAVDGTLTGGDLEFAGINVGSLNLNADVSKLQPPQGKLVMRAKGVTAGAFSFGAITLDADGDRRSHQLDIDATGSPVSARLALTGSVAADGHWLGKLKTLDLVARDEPRFALDKPADLSWNGKTFTTSDICIAANGPRLCIVGSAGSDGSGTARYRIERLPLALLARIGAPRMPLKVEGLLIGEGKFQRSASGALDGHAVISSDSGSVAYTDASTKPLLSWSGLGIDVTLSQKSTHASLKANLDHHGKLAGSVTLNAAPGGTQALSGTIDLDLNSLAFIELLTSEVANTSGKVQAHYKLAGTTAAPRVIGALKLEGFAAEVPTAGLKLHDGNFSLHATDPDHFVLKGKIDSGDGSVTITGRGGLTANAPLKVSIEGNNFLAADIPAALVVITPDLAIDRDARRLNVDGSVTVVKADIDLSKLPGGGAAKTSRDVVVTDAKAPQAGEPLPVVVAVTVKLGDAVKLAGFGLNGEVAGQLTINQRPGRAATGTGTVNVSGTYKAYGQDLTIETGRLLFAGTALDNPGLDISAVRNIQNSDIKAGLKIRGTALVPVLTVYSEPVMEQSEALAYLLTGKPLSGVSSGEGDMLSSAARALGTAGGNLLAKGIGKRLGVNAGISDSAALGGAAFTVGRYLSPKVYLSYGVGVFNPGEVMTLRYLVSKRLNFEAENATTGNRAGISYRIEK